MVKTPKKTAAKKATGKKTSKKKTAAKKTVAKTTKKSAAKKAGAKKSVTNKATAKKATRKKAAPQKAALKPAMWAAPAMLSFDVAGDARDDWARKCKKKAFKRRLDGTTWMIAYLQEDCTYGEYQPEGG